MNNKNMHNDNSDAAATQRPWWTVRGSLLATLGALSLVLGAMVGPTPLAKWVFGEATVTLASR